MEETKDINFRVRTRLETLKELAQRLEKDDLAYIIHELEIINKLQQEESSIDGLTGALNNKGIANSFEHAVNVCKVRGKPISILYFDLDGFKEVNDNFGHEAGDDVLKRAAAILRDLIRETDILGNLGRKGGDEFIAILPESDIKGAKIVAERIKSKFSTLIFDENKGYTKNLSISTGAAEIGSDYNLKRTLEEADKNMYKDKNEKYHEK